jgi:hypothetical protein
MSHPRSVVQQQETSHASQNPIGSADGPHIWTVESAWHKWYETAGRNTTFLLWDHMAAQPSQSSGVLTCQPSRFFSRWVRKLFGWFSIVKHDIKCISTNREYGGTKTQLSMVGNPANSRSGLLHILRGAAGLYQGLAGISGALYLLTEVPCRISRLSKEQSSGIRAGSKNLDWTQTQHLFDLSKCFWKRSACQLTLKTGRVVDMFPSGSKGFLP